MEDGGNDEKKMVEEPLLEGVREKGGFRTLPFIIGAESFEKMATYGLSSNMTLYLMNEYHMEMTTASNVLFIWSAATNFMPLLGALISDSFLGRFHTIGFGSIICLMGMILLWSTATLPYARPPPCDQSNTICIPPTTFQFLYLCLSLGLISIGAGGIRSSSLAFGADQLEKKGFHDTPGVKQSYFGWYYATFTVSVLISLTCVVYIQDNLGWAVGFAVPAVLMLFAVASFFLASPFYVRFKSSTSLITGFVQVAVVSFKNRHLKLSDSNPCLYHSKNGHNLVLPSQKLRFLNKACIVRDARKGLATDTGATDPWRICTVEQVEELKALLKVVPIWSSGVIMSVNLSQSTFPVLQAVSMDRHLTSSFEIPAASFGLFVVVAVILWVAVYDRVFLPLASRLKGRPVRLSTKHRMGLGIFLSFLAMIVSAIVEGIRRSVALRNELLSWSRPATMSALWLIPQNCLTGFAEAANAIAQNEFYFSEFPRSMSSIASTLLGIGMALGNLLASFIMNTVNYLSEEEGSESWISTDINKGHYDYYYLVLAGLSMANMVYFLVCSAAFGPLKEERRLPEEEEEEEEI